MNVVLQNYVSTTLQQPVHPTIKALADVIRAKQEHVQAVLAYGSALRDSNPENTLVDFYVLTQSAADVSQNHLSRFLCRAVPPNVYFASTTTGRCKYAVMPMEKLARKVSADISNPYFWARFSQPMQLVWCADDIAEKRVAQILVRAMETAAAHAKKLAPGSTVFDQWVQLFQNTYRTELRPEDASRARLIVDMQRAHFEKISEHAQPVFASSASWVTRRWQGKLLSVLRLLKAAFTFQGGADYAAWKIKRHSGVEIEVTDWQRRHPILASIILLPKLLNKGALK
jgi:hypothetical protein